jgi:N-acetylglucosamine-6-phosphate deacetylase
MLTVGALIDLQINGYRGVDFSGPDLTADSFANACREVINDGTSAFLPTVITSPVDLYRRSLPLIAEVASRGEFKDRILGIHLEGPFLSAEPGAAGSHNPAHVLAPDIDVLERLLDWADGRVRLLTIAADQPGADELARFAVEQGITVSLGHHLAGDADLERLAAAGAKALTHLGNGLPHMLARHHNPLVAGLASDNLSAMIIGDGHHLPPSLIKVIIRTKGPDRIILTSDATSVAGLGPGRYVTLGTEAVLEPSGLLHNPRTGYMVGSSANILQCLNYLASLKLLSPEQLIKLVHDNPLRLLDIEPGRIRPARNIRFDPACNQFLLT